MSPAKRLKLQIVEKNEVLHHKANKESKSGNKIIDDDSEDKPIKSQLGHNDVLLNRYIVTTKARVRRTGPHSKEVSYFIKSLNGEDVYQLVLVDTWGFEKELNVNEEISIMDVEKDENLTFRVSRDKGYVIVNPDRLFTITSIVGQSWCERKVAIQESFKGSMPHVSAFRGTMAHLFITDAMTHGAKTIKDFKKLAESVIRNFKIREDAYGHGLSEDELVNMVINLIPDISDFVTKRFQNRGPGQKWEIVKVQDIEDNYWSPSFGIKGKIDATVSIKTTNNLLKTVPLEFKTGSSHMKGRSRVRSEHVGQLNLYTLMMRPRYGPIDEGILSYITEDGFNEITISLRDLQALIQARNRLESNTRINDMNMKVNIRPDADFDLKCQHCEVQSTCAILLSKQNFTLQPTKESNKTERKLYNSLSYLKTLDVMFWDTWYDVITLEADEGTFQENLAKLWKEDPDKRAKTGTCLHNLRLKSDVITPVCEDNDVVRYIVSLSLDSQCDSTKILDRTFISEKDLIILSTDTEICIAMATVLQIKEEEIRLSLEDNIAHKKISPNTIFTIDKMISNSASKSLLSYLSMIMKNNPEATRLREYIIRRKQPVFSKMNKVNVELLTPIVEKLNDDQLKLMSKSLSTDSFLFVKGMPGTGKTFSIVMLLQLLVHQKKSVLLVSYTHTAIDNVLLRFKEGGNSNFIRIDSGRLGEPELRSRLSSTISKSNTYANMCKEFDSVPVIGTTLLSLGHAIFQRRKFDYCIIDEASQALLPSVLGALLLSDKYIVFGDQDQLPPVIKSNKVKEMKFSDNIFSLMATPMNTVKMTVQYRMNSHIMSVANKLVYKDQMSCSSKEVENRSIGDSVALTLANVLKECPSSSKSSILKIISGDLKDSVLIVNTRRPENPETILGDSKLADSFQNTLEADIVTGVVRLFVQGGLHPDSIGIIAPYRAQVHLLKQKMMAIADIYKIVSPVEVNTVDQYQGREKDVIICSFTKSNTKHQSTSNATDETKGGILEDMRRLNVAITRAKKKLVLIGDSTTLRNYTPFGKLFGIIPEKDHIYVNSTDFNNIFPS